MVAGTTSGAEQAAFSHTLGGIRTFELRQRLAVGLVSQILGAPGLEEHPEKTFIGRIERGFDYLGYHFSADNLTLAVVTMANFADRASRLYEQKRERPDGPSRLGAYVRRWCAWASGGAETVWLGMSLVVASPWEGSGLAGVPGA